MHVGNIPSSLNIRPAVLINSGMGDAGSFFSDIMNMYRETNTQRTTVALSQAETARAEAAARAAIAAAQAKNSPGLSTQTQLLLAGAGVAGVWWLGKKKRRR